MGKKLTTEEFIRRSKSIHGDKYDYSKTKYVKSSIDVCIICHIHDKFTLVPFSHLQGNGCPECGKIQKANKFRKPLSVLIKEANVIHNNNKYIYDEVEYVNNKTNITLKYPIQDSFSVTPNDHLSKKCGCPIYGNHLSRNECEIYDYIKIFSKDALQRDNKVIKPKELDIYVPSKNLAIEVEQWCLKCRLNKR